MIVSLGEADLQFTVQTQNRINLPPFWQCCGRNGFEESLVIRYCAPMTWRLGDTIAALASAPGAGGRGIVRVSGAEVKRVVSEHFHPTGAARWERTRRAEWHPGTWRLQLDVPWDDAPLRDGLRLPVDVGLWPTARSYTGQPLAELHLVSSPPLLEALVS